MTNNIKLIDLLYFKGKIGDRHIILESSKNNRKFNNFLVRLSIIK